jgi:hypothetical protein
MLLHRPQALPFFDEYYRELGLDGRGRDVEADAAEADLTEEKMYE